MGIRRIFSRHRGTAALRQLAFAAGEGAVEIDTDNKIKAIAGDLASRLEARNPRGPVRRSSIYTLIAAADHDRLAAVLNRVRRSVNGARAGACAQMLSLSLADDAPGERPYSGDETSITAVSAAREPNVDGERRLVRIQHLSRGKLLLVFFPQPVGVDGLPVRDDVRVDGPATTDPARTDRLLADLSHEMKTPLNAILGFSDTMRERTFGPLGHEKYEAYADHIHTAGSHLMDLVTALLVEARATSENAGLTLQPTSLDNLIDDCAAMVRPQIEDAGLRLTLETPADIGLVMVDRRVVRQILVNLVTNAIKFTSDGRIRVITGVVDIEGEPTIELTVKDTGMGMSREDLAHLGDRFMQRQANGVRGTEGHGLGLSLVQSLAQLHGGSLSLNSAPGCGLTATVLLPLTHSHLTGSDSRQANERRVIGRTGRPDDHLDAHLDDPRAGKPAALQSQLDRIEDHRRALSSKAVDCAAEQNADAA